MADRGRWFDPAHVETWDDNPHRLNPARAPQLELLTELACAAMSPGDHLIDLACGTGHLAELLLGKNPDMAVTLVDYSDVVLARARDRLGDRAARVDFRQLDLTGPLLESLPAEHFQVAVSIQSLHHFDDPMRQKQLRDMADLLCPGGLMLIQDRFAIAHPALFADYQTLWRQQSRLHDLELPDEPLPSGEGEQAADLGWLLGELASLGLRAAPLALTGTRGLLAARKPG